MRRCRGRRQAPASTGSRPHRSARSTRGSRLPAVTGPERFDALEDAPGGEPMRTGQLIDLDGRPALHFERHLAHSVEHVWRAVTEPSELAQWFVGPVAWTPRSARRSTPRASDVGHRARPAPPHRVELGRRAVRVRARRVGPGCSAAVHPRRSTTGTGPPPSTPPGGRHTSTGSTRSSPAEPRSTRSRPTCPIAGAPRAVRGRASARTRRRVGA